MNRTKLCALLAAFCLTAIACGGSPETPGGQSASAPAPQTIKADGSSTVFPITEAVAEEFQKANRDVRVTVGESGTGGGFKMFCRGEADISDASRPISPAELDACGKASIVFLELPVAYDGLAVVAHPKNTWARSMTVQELKRLWEPAAENKITRWNQVRTGWPDRPIHLFGPGVASGTFDYFTEAIVGKARSSRGDYTSSEDDNVLVQGVAGDEGALGYFGLAYFEQNQNRVKLVAIDDGNDRNGTGAIMPSAETVRGGTYRPLSRPLFIYINQQSLARPELKAFAEFYLAKGPALAREVGYVQLSDREYQLVNQRFGAGTTGTMFGGATQSGSTLETLLSSPSAISK